MTEDSARLAAEIVAAYDFSGFRTIVDVGGGQGWLLSAILRAVPAARGVLVDVPRVIETARALLAERGVADGCKLVGGSFFESIPAGSDAYVLKWIIHDWNDADATRILRTVRAAVPRTGRLIVFDSVLPERVREGNPLDQRGTLIDLNHARQCHRPRADRGGVPPALRRCGLHPVLGTQHAERPRDHRRRPELIRATGMAQTGPTGAGDCEPGWPLSRRSDHRRRFDLDEDGGMEEPRHAEKRRCGLAAGLGQPPQACGRRLPEPVDVGRVVVEPHDVREL